MMMAVVVIMPPSIPPSLSLSPSRASCPPLSLPLVIPGLVANITSTDTGTPLKWPGSSSSWGGLKAAGTKKGLSQKKQVLYLSNEGHPLLGCGWR
jgi:hypothetical protein